MLDANGVRGSQEYVTYFGATEGYEQEMHWQLSSYRLRNIRNAEGGYSRETYQLGHSVMAHLLSSLGQPVPTPVLAHISNNIQTRRDVSQRVARTRPLISRATVRFAETKQATISTWSRIKRWFRSLHMKATNEPRTWLRLPSADGTGEGKLIQVMSHYLGEKCRCGRCCWFDLKLPDADRQWCACGEIVKRPSIPSGVLQAA